MWQCTKCKEQIDEASDTCWRCGTSHDGIEDPSFRRVEDVRDSSVPMVSTKHLSPKSVLACARCELELNYVGTKNFHEGTRWGILGDLGELFVNKEKFDVYCCPKCGRVEFFVDGIGEEFRSQ
jgi:hypothetical protein